MTRKRRNVAVVGVGAMGRRHARVLGRLVDRFELIGAFDVHPEAAARCRVTALRSEADAIARCEVLVVATPIDHHLGVASAALAAGRHVLVEKPLCATAADAQALASRAASTGQLFVGHSERFNPVVRALAALVRDDDVVAIDLRRVGPGAACGHGVLLNWGVHDFDLAAYLGGGDCVIVRAATGGARASSPLGGPAAARDGEDTATVLLATRSGAIAHVHVDRTAAVKERAIVVTTRRWIYEGDLVAHRLVRIDRHGSGRREIALCDEEPLAAQACALADALDGDGRSEIATGGDGARAVVLAQRAARGVLAGSVAAQEMRVHRAPLPQSAPGHPGDPLRPGPAWRPA